MNSLTERDPNFMNKDKNEEQDACGWRNRALRVSQQRRRPEVMAWVFCNYFFNLLHVLILWDKKSLAQLAVGGFSKRSEN